MRMGTSWNSNQTLVIMGRWRFSNQDGNLHFVDRQKYPR